LSLKNLRCAQPVIPTLNGVFPYPQAFLAIKVWNLC